MRIDGDNSGQLAAGDSIHQHQQRDITGVMVSDRDIAAAGALFADLRARVAADAPAERTQAALEKVDELQKAVTAKSPKISTMEYVRDWFADNVPKLAGVVTSVVVNPIVGKLVQAGGDLLNSEFHRRFGTRADPPMTA
ncbi:MAG: hypothetical protein M3N52_13820 [Actinomycetota bacterium]|nr:hypothetical protein [Actinomycetota bacterium]